jgi:beta-lactamase regulating signal transducer with metallopeptidase domain
MRTLLEMGLSNALAACLLALLAAAISRVCRRPALAHCLWLLVLLKLVTPPIIPVSVPWPVAAEPAEADCDNCPCSQPRELEKMLTWPAPLPDREPLPGKDVHVATEQRASREMARANALSSEMLNQPPARLAVAFGLAVGPEPGARPEAAAAHGHTAVPGPSAVAVPWAWQEWGLAIWLAGSVLWFAWAGLHIRRFDRLLEHARLAPADLRLQVQNLAQRLGLARCPALWLVPGAVSPMVWAVGTRPRLLFPSRLLERLDPEQRTTLLAHELAHVRRRDHWVRFLELVVSGLFWWHPVVWWARREIHEAEELCCDAWVLWALDGADRPYALALLQTVAFFTESRAPLPVAASGIGQVPHLKRRLTMIMQGKTSKSLSRAGWLAVAVLAVGVLPFWPVQGQQPAPGSKTDPKSKNARDQEIEALKRAIQILEDLKQKDQDEDAPKKADEAEIEKARAEAEELSKVVAVKRKELEEAVARQREAMVRLKQLMAGMKRSEEQSKVKEKIMLDKTSKLKDAIKALTIVGPQGLKKPAAPMALPSLDDKTRELEQRLERIQKEIEELKQQLRKGGKPEDSDDENMPQAENDDEDSPDVADCDDCDDSDNDADDAPDDDDPPAAAAPNACPHCCTHKVEIRCCVPLVTIKPKKG